MTLDDVIPPEVLVDEAPVSDQQIDQWMADRELGSQIGQEVGPPPWLPSDTENAEYAMARYATLRAELNDIADRAMGWHQQIAAWQEREEHRRTTRLAFYDIVLVEYAERWRAEDPKHRKTLDLPSGKVTCTEHKAGRVVVSDEAQLMAWLQDHPHANDADVRAVKYTDPEVMISGVRKLVAALMVNGEWVALDRETQRRVPGAVAEPPDAATYRVVPD